jgi:hypothetical protein
MKSVPYASVIGSLMYAQVCARPNLAFVTGMLGRYQKNPAVSHWNEIKKALRYIQGTKCIMLAYERSDSIEIVGYSDSDFQVIWILIDPRQVMYSNSQVRLYRGVAPSRLS